MSLQVRQEGQAGAHPLHHFTARVPLTCSASTWLPLSGAASKRQGGWRCLQRTQQGLLCCFYPLEPASPVLAFHARFTQPLCTRLAASSPARRAAGGRVCGPVGALYEAQAAAGRGRPIPQVSVLWVRPAGPRQQQQQAPGRGAGVHRQQRQGPRQWGGQRRGGRVSSA